MFYREAFPKFWFVFHVDSLLTIGDRHWRKLPNQQIHSICTVMGAFSFMWGTYFYMGAHKCDVIVVIKMCAHIHGVLLFCGCLLSQFYGNSSRKIPMGVSCQLRRAIISFRIKLCKNPGCLLSLTKRHSTV